MKTSAPPWNTGCPPQLAGAWASTESPCSSQTPITSRYSSAHCLEEAPLCWTQGMVGLENENWLWAEEQAKELHATPRAEYQSIWPYKIWDFFLSEAKGILIACISWESKDHAKPSTCIIVSFNLNQPFKMWKRWSHCYRWENQILREPLCVSILLTLCPRQCYAWVLFHPRRGTESNYSTSVFSAGMYRSVGFDCNNHQRKNEWVAICEKTVFLSLKIHFVSYRKYFCFLPWNQKTRKKV